MHNECWTMLFSCSLALTRLEVEGKSISKCFSHRFSESPIGNLSGFVTCRHGNSMLPNWEKERKYLQIHTEFIWLDQTAAAAASCRSTFWERCEQCETENIFGEAVIHIAFLSSPNLKEMPFIWSGERKYSIVRWPKGNFVELNWSKGKDWTCSAYIQYWKGKRTIVKLTKLSRFAVNYLINQTMKKENFFTLRQILGRFNSLKRN
jgi:hypothetical protein